MSIDDASTATDESWLAEEPDGTTREVLALTILWSLTEPHRVGETALLPKNNAQRILGRGAGKADEHPERLKFFRQRPGHIEPRDPLSGPGISRRQLDIRTQGDGLVVKRLGRCPLLVNSVGVESALLSPGDTIMLRNQLLLLCSKRPLMLPHLEYNGCSPASVPFGGPDEHGIVGESPGVWRLRGQLPFLARRSGHVLVQGASGTGKELISRALHLLSSRGRQAIVARNAATFPAGLIDAELFGNIKDYPNTGMRERRGLIGEAHGSTLFLDEIGELPDEMQAHLLRVLDSEGSYQRLGEDKPRKADIRLIAATNRDPEHLRPDFLARLALRISVPGINERRDDIPLLVRHLLERAASQDPDLRNRLFRNNDDGTQEPRIDPNLMDLLVRHKYTNHVRELESFLWLAMTGSLGRFLPLTDELRAMLTGANSAKSPSLSPEVIQACLDKHEGNQTKVCQELGLKNRHVLYRLIKKHGLIPRRAESDVT